MIRAPLLCALGVVLVLGAGSAQAAFPGVPGPIAYSKTSTNEVGEGSVERVGGLFVHGPRRRQEPRQLTTDPDDHSPSYSADGRWIVFASDDRGTGRGSIFVMRSDGSERREVTADGLGGSDPVFFPSGNAIAFVRGVDGHSQIFTAYVDGAAIRQVTSGPHDNYDPAISPSGRRQWARIAFTSNRDPDGRRDRGDIFTMRSDGSDVRVLIDGPRSEYDLDWAPSGRRVAFGSNRGRGAGVFVARANGSGVERLTPCNPFPPRCRGYFEPAFSPDGGHIAVLGIGRRTSTISVLRGNGDGFTMTVDSGGVEEEGFGSNVGAPTWGPRPR